MTLAFQQTLIYYSRVKATTPRQSFTKDVRTLLVARHKFLCMSLWLQLQPLNSWCVGGEGFYIFNYCCWLWRDINSPLEVHLYVAPYMQYLPGDRCHCWATKSSLLEQPQLQLTVSALDNMYNIQVLNIKRHSKLDLASISMLGILVLISFNCNF